MFPSIRSKNVYEAVMLKKRIAEEKRELMCKENTNFYQKSATRAEQVNRWTSDASFNNSMMAYLQPDKDTLLERLEERRTQLRNLLSEEANFYENLRCCPSAFHGEAYSKFKPKRESKEANQEPTELLERRDTENNPHLCDSQTSRGDTANEEQKVQDEGMIEKRTDKERVKQAHRKQVTVEERALSEERHSKRSHSAKLQQMNDAFKQREVYVEELNGIRKEILQEQAHLDDLEEESKMVVESRQRERYGKALLRQHTAALKRRSQQVQAELEHDLAWIAKLGKAAGEVERGDKLRERFHSEILTTRALLEDDLERERVREADMNDLYASEATEMWKKLDEQWKYEQEARHILLNNILVSRQEVLSEKLAAVRQMQAQKMAEREEILQEMEALRSLSPTVKDAENRSQTSTENLEETAEDAADESALREKASKMKLCDSDAPITVKPIGMDKEIAVTYRGVPFINHRRRTHLW